MNRHFKALASLVLLCATSLIWLGCSGSRGGYGRCCTPRTYKCYYDCESTCNPCCQAIEPESDVCCPCGPQTASGICWQGVQVIVRQTQMCQCGDKYPLDIEVRALRDVCDVTIYTSLPEPIEYVSSDPEAFQDGSTLVWKLSHMDCGECRNIRVFLRCDREGCFKTCFCVNATPVAGCVCLCARPVLDCCKTGPEEACPGDCLNYTICVTNNGSCAAHDVVVVDHLPEELEHPSGQCDLTFKLGTLCPCQTKSLNLCLKACKRGRATNRITVSSCNADPVSCEHCTVICKYCCEVDKEGPKEVKIGQNADYTVSVTNVGDRSLTDVCVVDDAPNGTTIVSAEGARIQGNRAMWHIDELRSGESINLPITLTTCVPGFYCNRAKVTSCQGACCCAEWSTRWRGTPALNVCTIDMDDPICVGDTTCYRITVINQGSEYDTNVQTIAHFPPEIVPVSAAGATAGQISGNTVTFAPYDRLGARETIEFRIMGRAERRGDARLKVEVMSDSIQTPIVTEESTIVN